MTDKKKIVLCISNDIVFDQRLRKVCTSLSQHGFDITLVGCRKKGSLPLKDLPYRQERMPLFFERGFLFFAEANIRMFFYLLFVKAHVFCANDLDMALPVYVASLLRRKKRVFDAHELFCEMHEIVRRPKIYKFWKALERFLQPHFPAGYTENESYANEYRKMYGVDYFVVMNSPVLLPEPQAMNRVIDKHVLIYQGVVDRGRGFEGLIPALQDLDVSLIVCGEGNIFDEVQQKAEELGVRDKIDFKGYVQPEALKKITPTATIGMNLNANLGASFYYSLSNRFFDYMHACIPQVTMNYPENRRINGQYEIAILIDDLEPATIAQAVRRLMNDKELYARLRANCLRAREVYNWNRDEQKLIDFYRSL